jgi:hypothetical protein
VVLIIQMLGDLALLGAGAWYCWGPCAAIRYGRRRPGCRMRTAYLGHGAVPSR